ncbi:DUF2690 domain-containing protein [Nocardioides bruguierae]|uniref:DUF2690 domain-containing protein n=1 Tax=Nocardioides bruguierae TaxID=2945102 RepID=A0A9X2D9E1_9ACTN|nr:DUF2690 domain-containing protein [Nocardioides bruguierae]MCM0621780.1 DUF2690 domain-containing protein [Nocardioides bruguierae]
MVETPDGDSPGYRPPEEPGYARLDDFKLDLRSAVALGGPNHQLPKVRSIAAVIGTSISTVSNALNVDDKSVPSEETVRGLATAYDHPRLGYWLERRAHIAAQTRGTGPASEIAPTSDPDAASSDPTGSSPRPRHEWVALLLTVTAILCATAAAMALWSGARPGPPSERPGTPTSSLSDATGETAAAARRGPADYSDPVAAGCVDAGSQRLKTVVVKSVGLVSLVHSASCDAYWARAERTDGKQVGNHVDLSITARGSNREPAVANDPDAATVYTYLLTGGDASGFCVAATFWVDEESFKSPRFCVDKQ